MKTVVLFILASFTYAGSVNVPCELLKSYEVNCMSTISTVGQPYSGTFKGDDGKPSANTPVKIEYVDSNLSDVVTTTNSKGEYYVNVIPDKPFYTYVKYEGKWFKYDRQCKLELREKVLNPKTGRWNNPKKKNIINISSGVTNIRILNITNHHAKAMWDGDSNATVWLVYKGVDGSKLHVNGYSKDYNNLGANVSLIFNIKGSNGIIQSKQFKTKEK